MESVTKPKAVLFDLDGTLINRQASIVRYAELFASEFRNELIEIDQVKIERVLIEADGHGYRAHQRHLDIAKKLLSTSSPEQADLHWRANFPGLAVLAEGVTSVLSKLRDSRVEVGLVTNGSTAAQSTKLQSLELTQYFDTISISEAIGVKKPDPRIFEATLSELNCPPEEAWFVGDHPVNDVWGAEQLGIRGFLLPGVDWPDGYEACGIAIDNLTTLLSYLE